MFLIKKPRTVTVITPGWGKKTRDGGITIP